MSDESAPSTAPPRTHVPRGVAMVGLAGSMFLVVLDTSMVNLAGRTIREGLGLTAAELTVVVDAYLVALAGLLLLGGRLADVLGGKRVFLAGTAVYVAASALCASAADGAVLTAGRVGQGIGAALLMPAALSLVLALYASPAERTRAMGVWGVLAGAGSLVGVVLGGTLTDLAGWPSVFWTPVPFGIAGAALVWWSAPEVPGRRGVFDAPGAIAITLGVSALALGLVFAGGSGWDRPLALGGLAVGAACLAAFVAIERRSAHPLVPLGVFTRTAVVKANAVMLLTGATLTSLFYLLPLYQQEGLGMSPTEAGLAQLPIAGTIIAGSGAAPLLAKALGLDRALSVGLAGLLLGFVWLVLDPTESGFSASLLGAFLLIGTGLGLGFVNAVSMAVRDSAEGESGLLSGLVNAAQQLGGAVGVAAIAGIALGAAGAHGDLSYTAAFLGQTAFIAFALALSFIPKARERSGPAVPSAR
ncbi:MFS transporter [Nocardiopsis baichengensis]|uniref:MFS transporter n=1 Tax=Nocardiopsis baichengensis TaxID=280240 RepID=UPI0003484BA4|nr:MFS transporter [Nocardiopsis baichengensis]